MNELSTKEELQQKYKIRKRPIEYVKLVGVFYERYTAISKEELGEVMEDLLNAMRTGSADNAKFQVNKDCINETFGYMAKKRDTINKWKEGRRKKEETQQKPEENLFTENKESSPYPKDWQRLQRHELQKIICANGITGAQFFNWYEYSSAGGFKDGYGNPIRNPIAACRAFKLTAGDGTTPNGGTYDDDDWT